jgi:hypothetical protein
MSSIQTALRTLMLLLIAHATQISTFGQFEFMKRLQTFYGGTGPCRVETRTILSTPRIIATAIATIVVAGLTLALVVPEILNRTILTLLGPLGRKESDAIDAGEPPTAQEQWRRRVHPAHRSDS